jgi:hypothetical protein
MSEINCPSCQAHLPAADLAAGWCENCGKPIPPYVLKEAAQAAVQPAGAPTPTLSPLPDAGSGGKQLPGRMRAYSYLALGVVCLTLAAGGFLIVLAGTGTPGAKGMARSLGDYVIVAAALVLAILFLMVGTRLINTSRRMRLFSAQQTLAKDERPPVLYLRSFRQGRSAAQVVSTDVSGTAAGPILSLLFLSIRTEEEQIGEVFNEIGPFVAIGRPGEPLPELGAARMYVGDDAWQKTVSDLMARARLVVFRAADTQGFWWEVERAAGLVEPARLVFLIPKDIDYERFRQRAYELLHRSLPAQPGPPLRRCGTLSSIIYFRPDGEARFLAQRAPWGRGRVRTPMVPVLKLMMKPVFEQLGVPWSPPPIRWGVFAAFLGFWLLLILAVVVAAAVGKRGEQARQTNPQVHKAAALRLLIGRWELDRRETVKKNLLARGADPSTITPEMVDGLVFFVPALELEFRGDGGCSLVDSSGDKPETRTGRWKDGGMADGQLTVRLTLGQGADAEEKKMVFRFVDDNTVIDLGNKDERTWKRAGGAAP